MALFLPLIEECNRLIEIDSVREYSLLLTICFAREILNARHYGMDRVKDYIDQYLAVMQHTNENKGSALLLIGAPGTGQIILTGQIGDVMKGSACISLSLLKSRLPMNAVNFKEKDIHIHVPSGATP